MKIFSLFLCCLLICLVSISQELRRSGPAGFAIYECDINGKGLVTDNPISGPAKAKFYILGDVPGQSDFVIIQYLNWYNVDQTATVITPFDKDKFARFNINISNNGAVADTSSVSTGQTANRRYFAVRKSDIDKLSIPYAVAGLKSATFSMGFITMPVKMRLKKFDFTDQFSFGATAGPKWRISNKSPNFFHVLFGVNIGFVEIDSTNSNPVSAVVKESYPAKNVGVLSPALGFVTSFGAAQVGLFLGADFLGKSNREKYNWVYNKKAWISFGIGFNLFSADKKADPDNNPSQK